MRNLGKGQGLVEFSLFLPIVIFLVLGALSIGQVFHVKVVLENAAREGAYFMVYNALEGKANSFALAKAAVQGEADNSGIVISDGDINIYCKSGEFVDNNCPEGSTVVVTVQHELSVIFDGLFGGPFNLANDAKMLIP